MKSITCREHGGTFTVLPRRGRPPVRCTEDNRCTALPIDQITHAVKKMEAGIPAIKNIDTMNAQELRAYARSIGASTITKLTDERQLRAALRKYQAAAKPTTPAIPSRRLREKLTVLGVVPETLVRPAEAAPETSTHSNPSLPLAMDAKDRLEALGWTCKGRAARPDLAWLDASRGEELISMAWEAGNLTAQNYILWNTDKPSRNGKPTSKLGFDPDELSDRELVERIAGMKVTWWNVLAGNTEVAVIPNKLTIQHVYADGKDAMPGDRIITFVDRNAGGFRTFRAGALLKVG